MTHPFEPVADHNSKILILGSFPSVKSREQAFYYGHKQNRFWKVLAQLLGCETPQTIAEKRDMLLSHGIAVWDVLQSCNIEGSADASIWNPVINDIRGLLEQTNIKAVFFNGKTAYRLYQTYGAPLPVEGVVLPSTSPANAAYSLQRLCGIWENELLKWM